MTGMSEKGENVSYDLHEGHVDQNIVHEINTLAANECGSSHCCQQIF